ncbi:MAG: hypothetical protein NTZ49_01995 [Candidatus Parcubacteria bacterium]|nr:hypothetical protein [Candidatus Parcubacteria bacterium]
MKKSLVIIFGLGILIFLSGCSFAAAPKNERQNDLIQQLNDLQSQLAKVQTEKQTIEENLKSREEILNTLPDKGAGVTSYCYWPKQLELKEVFPDLDLSKVSADYQNYLGQGGLQQVCISDRGDKAFIMYGDFGKENNIVGFFTQDSATGENKWLFDKQYDLGMGDIGVCHIDGFIERNLVYSCGGGDGPGGFNTVYVLDRKTGTSKIIKKCDYYEDKATCSTNFLKLEAPPF